MTTKAILQQSVARFLAQRPGLHDAVTRSPRFKEAGAVLYGGETTVNMPFILELFDRAGGMDFIAENRIRTVADFGGANGDISFAFSLSGFETTFVDAALPTSKCNGPLTASLINAQLEADVRVIDHDLDRHFSYTDLIEHTVNNGQFKDRPASQCFDLVICVGLFYHLKNPFAFLESLARLGRFCVLGTFCMSHLPDNVTRVRETPIAYLLDGERNNDPTNYWIFTHASYERLAKRSGFDIESSVIFRRGNEKIANPIDNSSAEQEFLLMKSRVCQ